MLRSIIAYLLIACGLIFVNCSGEDESKKLVVPADVLSQDSMAYYLAQVHIIDAMMRNRTVRKSGLQDEARQAYIVFFDTAEISEQRFKRSLSFWKNQFEEMEGIYDASMEIISTKIAKLKQNESAEEVENDGEKEEDQPKKKVPSNIENFRKVNEQ